MAPVKTTTSIDLTGNKPAVKRVKPTVIDLTGKKSVVKRVKPQTTTEHIKWANVWLTDKNGKERRTRKLVSHNGAYWNNAGRFQKRLDKLNKEHMPKCGACENTDSMLELLRHVQAMYYQNFNNGPGANLHCYKDAWRKGIFKNPAFKTLSTYTQRRLRDAYGTYEYHDKVNENAEWLEDKPREDDYDSYESYREAEDCFYEHQRIADEHTMNEVGDLLDAALDEIVEKCPLRG